MWRYYAESNICYAYMVDVPTALDARKSSFRRSRWHTRGWTLQELIAPPSVEFYARNWAPIGTKSERYLEIAKVTNINASVLNRTATIYDFSAAEKLSWAAHRDVTREEDETYCLLGIFDVSMPMLYGEGRRKAFFRLQETIYSSTFDHSLFLFRYSDYADHNPLLAESPEDFCPIREHPCDRCFRGTKMTMAPDISYDDLITATNMNVQAHDQIWTTAAPNRSKVSTTLQLLDYYDVSKELFWAEDPPDTPFTHVAVLNYTLASHKHGALCLLLYCSHDDSEGGDVTSSLFCRVNAYPVLLPSWKEFSARIRLRRVLVCAEAKALSGDLPLTKRNRGRLYWFTLVSNSFIVESWDARNVRPKQGGVFQATLSADFVVWVRHDHIMGEGRPEVSCRIVSSADSAGHASHVAIYLAWFDTRWWIQKAHESQSLSTECTQPEGFSAQGSCDRCVVHTSNGTELFIALRRLAGKDLWLWGPIESKYQIVVEARPGHQLSRGYRHAPRRLEGKAITRQESEL